MNDNLKDFGDISSEPKVAFMEHLDEEARRRLTMKAIMAIKNTLDEFGELLPEALMFAYIDPQTEKASQICLGEPEIIADLCNWIYSVMTDIPDQK